MATYYTNFSLDTVGSPPANWTERWYTTSGSLNVAVEGGAIGGQVLQILSSSTARYAASWDTPDSPADVEILVKMKCSANFDDGGRVILRGAYSSSIIGYMAYIQPSVDQIRVGYYNNSTSFNGLANLSYTISINTYYWIRFRINGTSIKCRIWNDGGSEPGTWNVCDLTDSTISAGGWIMVGKYYNSGTTIDYIGIGTDGDTAPGPDTLATVTTDSITDITKDSCTATGTVVSDGGSPITERGFVYGTTAFPTLADDNIVVSGTIGVYSGSITGLTSGTTYHVRAYATNSASTQYADGIDFDTLAITAPVVATYAATDVLSTSAVGNGEVISDGGGTITERGFCWSTSANPTTADTTVTSSGTLGDFSETITGLSASTLYHYRAYAINSEVGTAYGDDFTILTTGGLPVISTGTVTTGNVQNINNVSSIAYGNVLSDGGSTITERGIVYALTDTPTLSDSVATASGTLGEFTATLTGLVKGTTYYYRAFATNVVGTAYGGIAHFVAGFESGIVTPTPAGPPKTIFPELPPKLRFKLDQEYPGYYYWYTDAKKFWNTVNYKGGSITLSAGTSTVVADNRVLTTSVIVLHPTNAGAAALTPYVSAKTAGVSFTLTHGTAVGTETFDYILYV